MPASFRISIPLNTLERIKKVMIETSAEVTHEDKVINIVLSKDEVTWQSALYELVRQEGMDPWDINVSLLSEKYIAMLQKLKEINFRVSGKMVLASAILLRLKSKRLVGEDLDELDRLMAPEGEFEGFYDELESEFESGRSQGSGESYPELSPRTPQPRKRKISIYDLMKALQQALEVKERRVIRRTPIKMSIPEKNVDISLLIKNIYERILNIFSSRKKVLFSELSTSNSKQDKIYAFVPLLHLANHDQRRVDLIQSVPFGEIEIVIRSELSPEVTAQEGRLQE